MASLFLPSIVAAVIGESAQLPPLTPSYHKFNDAINTIDPNSGGASSDAILNRLQQLADAYPAFVTLTTTQKLFGVDGEDSYALIIQDKQGTQNKQDPTRTDVSAQLELVESTSNLKDVVDWFRHSVHSDDVSSSDVVASRAHDEEAAVPSTITTYGDIILSAATIGTDKVVGLAEVMLKAAHCESVDDSHDGNSNVNFLSDRRLQCRTDLRSQGVGTKDVEWLAHLVFTRRTIILSAATQGDIAPHHSLVVWLVVACVGLLLTVALMTVLTAKRKHRNRIWLEEEAKRRVAVLTDNDDYYESLLKDFTSELTSFDEELTVQLIEPSHNVIVV